ncbi:MAG: hypothetical protein ABL956_12650 [Hyphomonadaceae bacterium]
MAPHNLQAEADARTAYGFISILILALMLTPFVISVFANIGRRPWLARGAPFEVKARALLAQPSRVAA